ncbi:MAG: cytochrome c biogenesis protein ResB [Bacillota bacterium]|nr:cytochrome c biogenesis protein ResB [Bacillota bacterium]
MERALRRKGSSERRCLGRALKKAADFLASVRLALVLLVLLTVASVVGVTAWEGIFQSGPFVLVALLFFINLLLCTARQFRTAGLAWRRARCGPWPGWGSGEGAGSPEAGEEQEAKAGSEAGGRTEAASGAEREAGERTYPRQALEAAAASLRRRGWRFLHREAGRLAWGKGLAGYWGSAVFHAGLAVVALGGLLTLIMRSWGAFGLLEGETFVDGRDPYLVRESGALPLHLYRGFAVRLDEVVLDLLPDGKLHDYKARVVLFYRGREVRRGEISGPTPLRYGLLTLYKHRFGYAPAFALLDAAGRELLRFYVTLETNLSGGNANVSYRGDFALPRLPYRAEATFYPDVSGQELAGGRRPRLATHRPGLPAVYLEVWRGSEPVWRGTVVMGREAAFAGYRLRFDHYVKWYGIAAAVDPGVPVLYLGFLLSTAGLALLYGFRPRLVFLWEEGGFLRLRGTTPRPGPLWREELAELRRAVEEAAGVEVWGERNP